MVIRLSIVSGKSEGRVIQVPSRQLVSLGRTVRADISLEDDPLVSSKHCEIEHNGSVGIVRDLGSTNGTYLNGQAIREAHLQHNDRLRIGSTELVIQLDMQSAASQAIRPAPARVPARPQVTPGPAKVTAPPAPAKDPLQPIRESAPYGAGEGALARRPDPDFRDDRLGTPILTPDAAAGPRNPPRGPIESYADSSLDSGFFGPLQAGLQQNNPGKTAPQQRPPSPIKAGAPAVNPIMISMEDSSHIVGHFDVAAAAPKAGAAAPQATEDTAVAPETASTPSRPSQPDGDPSVSPPAGDRSLANDPSTLSDPPHAPPVMRAVTRPADRVAVPEHRMIRALPPEMTAFGEQACGSGLSLFQTLPTELSQAVYTPSSLVDILAQRFAVVVVLHFQRVQQETPDGLGSAHPLFDWLPESSARQYGPILVEYDQLCATGNVVAIDQLWGHDGCLVFFGADRKRLFEHVSGLIHRAVPGLSQEGGVFHFCWPSVLGQLLEKQSSAIADVVFADVIAGVLTEISMQPIGWQIFAPSMFGDELRALGLQAAPSSA